MRPLEPTVLKHSVALRLFFGNKASPNRLEEMLKAFIADIKSMLEQISDLKQEIEEDFFYPKLVSQWGKNYYEQEIASAQQILDYLETQK